jgi:hypothetical protein
VPQHLAVGAARLRHTPGYRNTLWMKDTQNNGCFRRNAETFTSYNTTASASSEYIDVHESAQYEC